MGTVPFGRLSFGRLTIIRRLINGGFAVLYALLISLGAMRPLPAVAAVGDKVINSATVGGGSSVTVAPSTAVAAQVTVTVGTGSDKNWKSTSWQIGSGVTNCVDTTDRTTAGSSSASFSITAPATTGTYNVTFTAHKNDTCNDGPSNPLTLNNAITVAIADTTAPVIAPHGNETAEATSASGTTVTYTNPTATDNKDASVIVNCSPVSGSTFPLGATAVTCNAEDAAGNDATPTTFTVTVSDTTAPVIAPHGNETAEATSGSGATVTYTAPEATDAVTSPVVVNCSPASGTTFPLGVTTVTCNAEDGAGNDATATTFSVTVSDTTAPVIDQPSDITVEAVSALGNVVIFADPDATDAVDGTISSDCDQPTGYQFPVGTTTVTCNVSDAAGNAATPVTFDVTVEDTTAPTVDLQASPDTTATENDTITVSTTNLVEVGSAAVSYLWVQVGGSTTALLSSTNTSSTGVSVTVPGTVELQLTVTDNFSNSSNESITLTFTDVTAPAVDSHADITDVEATGPGGAVVTFTNPSATDELDASVAVTCTPSSGSTFGLGTTTVDCSATDTAGNTGSNSFSVSVVDTTVPVIDSHADITGVEATGPGGADVTYTLPSVTDLVDGTTSASCTPVPGSTFIVGTTTVNCSAQDSSGNDALATSFTVTVVDTTAPVIDSQVDIAASFASATGGVVNYIPPGVLDLVDGVSSAVCLPAPGSVFPVGTTTVNCTAVDAAGNTAVPTSFAVVVTDSTPAPSDNNDDEVTTTDNDSDAPEDDTTPIDDGVVLAATDDDSDDDGEVLQENDDDTADTTKPSDSSSQEGELAFNWAWLAIGLGVLALLYWLFTSGRKRE